MASTDSIQEGTSGEEKFIQKKVFKEVIHFIVRPENPIFEKVFAQVEKITKLPRHQVVYGIIGILILYLTFGNLAHLVCNLIGFGYPVYASIKTIQTIQKNDHIQWLIYWIVFSVFSLLDPFLETVIPIYWLGKTFFLVYLASPSTQGTSKIHLNLINPLVSRLETWCAPYSNSTLTNISKK